MKSIKECVSIKYLYYYFVVTLWLYVGFFGVWFLGTMLAVIQTGHYGITVKRLDFYHFLALIIQ